MTLDQFINWMNREISRVGSQRKFADKYKVDKAVVSLVVGGHREPSEEFSKALGWEKIPEFRRITNDKA